MTASAGAVTLGPMTAQATTNSATALQVKSTAKASNQVKSTAKARLSKVARQKVKAKKAVSTARKQIGDPYRWGATGPGAFDCSGLPSSTHGAKQASSSPHHVQPVQRCQEEGFVEQLAPGDLMFFSGKGHVGMYVGKGRMVHSPSSGKTVRVVRLEGYYKSSFVGAVRPGG